MQKVLLLTMSVAMWAIAALVVAEETKVGNLPRQFVSTGIPACDALFDAGLGDSILLATDTDYAPQIETWWALQSRQTPWCLVLSRSAEEVSTALRTLSLHDDASESWSFAIKSGGHSVDSNIQSGVTIDLSFLNQSTYHPESGIASVGPGARWADAFADLLEQGVTVTGGRDGGVGVGGFLTGGGISFYAGRNGLGCDTVVNFEVVLANGTIVNANKTANADLWKALKGGSGNLGIVTRFDLETLPAVDLAYGEYVYSLDDSNAVLDATVSFTDNMEHSPDDALVTLYYYIAGDPVSTINTLQVNTKGNLSTTSFDLFRRTTPLQTSWESKSYAAAADGSRVPPGSWVSGFTLTLRNTPEDLQISAQLYNKLIADLSHDIGKDSFSAFMVLQPWPKVFAEISAEKGGNMLGLEDQSENHVMWSFTILTNSNEVDAAVTYTRLASMTAELRAASASDFLYLNYADASQDPIGSYGAANVGFLRDVAAKYDPTAVFQRQVPGGFKVDGW